jgi:hypothetical protein
MLGAGPVRGNDEHESWWPACIAGLNRIGLRLMDWVIDVSKTERGRSVLSPQTAEAACRALRTQGVALLRGAFSKVFIAGLYKEFITQFGAMDSAAMNLRAKSPPPHPFLKTGGKRFDIVPRMAGVFADPAVYAHPILLQVLSTVLGPKMRLGGFTIVVSFPGASVQHIHRDHSQLFPEGDLGTVLPAYAINVNVPLVDVDMETGPTGVWLGSHRWPESHKGEPETVTCVPFRRGDCLLLDYRTIHSGMPNQSRRRRPILYMPYARGWFFDDENHKGRPTLDMPLDTYLALPESLRPLLLRAYTQAMRAQLAAGIAGATPSSRESPD